MMGEYGTPQHMCFRQMFEKHWNEAVQMLYRTAL